VSEKYSEKIELFIITREKSRSVFGEPEHSVTTESPVFYCRNFISSFIVNVW